MALENGNFHKGLLPMIVLSLLNRNDMYGYELVQETANSSGGLLTTQEGSLYLVLYRLQEQGLISAYRVKVGKRMTRVYYHLEPAGAEHLVQLVQEYRKVTQGAFQIIEGGTPQQESEG